MSKNIKQGGKNKISNYIKMKIPKSTTKTGQLQLRKAFEIKRRAKVIPFAKSIGYMGNNVAGAYDYLQFVYKVIVEDANIDDKVFLLFNATVTPYWISKDGTKKTGKVFIQDFKKIIKSSAVEKEYKKLKNQYIEKIESEEEWKEDYNYVGGDIVFSKPKTAKLDKEQVKKIKKRYALNKADYLNNEIWDKGRDMCVVDFIQYRYSPNEKNKKGYNLNKILFLGKKFNQEKSDRAIEFYSTHTIDGKQVEDLDQNPNKNGYDVEHIDLFCKNMRINVVALINNNIIHTGLYKKANGNIPNFVFELNSGHLYPVVNETLMRKIMNTAKNVVISHPDTKNKFHTDTAKEYKPKYQIKKHTKIFDINTGKLRDANPLEYHLNLINNELETLPTYPYNIKQKNGHILPLKMDDTMYYYEKKTDENKSILEYLKSKKIKFNGQTPQTFTSQFLNNDNYLLQLGSYYTPVLDKILSVKNIKNRTHYGLVDIDSNKYFADDKKINSYDINKCYRKSMEDLDYLLYINYDVGIEYYNDNEFVSTALDIPIGLYYLETDDYTLLHGSNWYSSRMTEYAIRNKIINDDNVKAYIDCKYSSNNPLKNIIKNISDEFDKFSNIKKIIINSIYGWLAKTHTKRNDIYIDEDLKRVWDDWAGKRGLEDKDLYLNKYFINTDHQWIKDYLKDNELDVDELLEINETKEQHEKIRQFYTYGERENIKHFSNYLPVAIQIQDESNIKLFELVKKTKGKLLYRKTDMVCVYGGVKIKESDKVGGYRKCENPTLPLSLENNTSAELVECELEWNDLKYNDSNDYENIINKFIENKGGLLLGRAGTGKSYVAIKGMEILDSNDLKHICAAYTNKATIQLKGKTLHSFLRVNDTTLNMSTKWAHKIRRKYDVIIIDEISMINEEMWKILTQLKMITDITFILIGDYRQLPPVEKDEKKDYDIDWFNHSVVHYLANGARCELNTMKRYDIKLWNALENLWEYDNYDVLKEQTLAGVQDLVDNINICYSNRTRKLINYKCMMKEKPNDAMLIKYNNKKTDDDKQHQDTYLYVGLPLYMMVTTDDKLFKKNELVRCIKYNNNNFTIKNDRGDVMEFEIKEFHCKVQAGYACTYYKSQGDTYTGKINIFETKQHKIRNFKREIYTALSRATKLENIKIRSGFK